MIYKKIKDTDHIWNPDTTLVFKSRKNMKVIGRYVDKQIIQDIQAFNLCKKHNIEFDTCLEKFNFKDETKNNIEKQDENNIQNQYENQDDDLQNYPFINYNLDSDTSSSDDITQNLIFSQTNLNTNITSISTEFIDILTEEFKQKINSKINNFVYKIIDLEATLKNVNNDYENLLNEHELLKKEFIKLQKNKK